MVSGCENQSDVANRSPQGMAINDQKTVSSKATGSADLIRDEFLVSEYEYATKGDSSAKLLIASACATEPYKYSFDSKFFESCLSIAKSVAESGDPAAEYVLSKYYKEGIGVTKNNLISSEYVIKSANNGFPEAQNTACMYYASGIGVEKDLKVAEGYCNSAIKGGYSKAASYLPQLIALRAKNEDAQFKADIKSIELRGVDLLRGRYSSRVYYKLIGFGVTPLTAEMFQRVKKWAISGNPLAQQMAANMLFNADGVSVDKATGYAWGLIASKSEKHKESFGVDSNINPNFSLPTKIINQGQNMASKWVVGTDLQSAN